jgi:hypothetical protein
MRMNRALLAAFLCSATAPAAMCDPLEQMSPFKAGQWPTLSDSRSEIRPAMAVPSSTTPEVMQVLDATVVLLERPSVDQPPAEETTAQANSLPSTSTATGPELQSRLLMACLGFALALAGGAMLLLPKR